VTLKPLKGLDLEELQEGLFLQLTNNDVSVTGVIPFLIKCGV
jgi:hypothetical protein